MKRNFVTGGRATIAYIVGITTGAIAFFPLFTAMDALRGGTYSVSRFGQVQVSGLDFWLHIELGAVLVAFTLPAAMLLPVFVAAMIVARWRKINHWFYYVMTGMILGIFLCVLTLSLDREQALFHSIFLARWLLLLAIQVGILGGGGCWLFLRMTYSDA